MNERKTCFIVVDGYIRDDHYIDGNIRIFATYERAEKFIKKSKEIMTKGKRPGDKFYDCHNKQTIVEFEIEK